MRFLRNYHINIMPWIEDKPENADVGASCGFESYLMEHGHNMDYEVPCHRGSELGRVVSVDGTKICGVADVVIY